MVVDFPIDFVVTWVDDGDPAWRKEKNEYQSLDHDDKTETQFRDTVFFKYLNCKILSYCKPLKSGSIHYFVKSIIAKSLYLSYFYIKGVHNV